MVPAVIFFCTAVAAAGPTALTCSTGETVILADIRAAAADQQTRERQRATLTKIVFDRKLRCQRVGARGHAIIARCTVDGRDVAASQVFAGNAEFHSDIMMADAARGRNGS